jgi:hypothetical protein
MLPRTFKMSNRTNDRDAPRDKLPRIFICGGGLHTVGEELLWLDERFQIDLCRILHKALKGKKP